MPLLVGAAALLPVAENVGDFRPGQQVQHRRSYLKAVAQAQKCGQVLRAQLNRAVGRIANGPAQAVERGRIADARHADRVAPAKPKQAQPGAAKQLGVLGGGRQGQGQQRAGEEMFFYQVI